MYVILKWEDFRFVCKLADKKEPNVTSRKYDILYCLMSITTIRWLQLSFWKDC